MSSPPDHPTEPQRRHSEATPAATSSTARRSQRPTNVKMPTPPDYRRTNSSGGPRSPSHLHSNTLETPSSEKNPSPGVSGPMSPGSSMGNNAFIFPIRSVFHGMQSSDSMEGGLNINRGGGERTPPPTLGRSGSQRDRQGHGRSASRQSNNRETFGINDEDAGIATIAQMLAQGSSQSGEPRQSKPTGSGGAPAVATFSGRADRGDRTDRNVSNPDRPMSAGGHVGQKEPPQGYFSVPAKADESAENPFFPSAKRPEIHEHESGETVTPKPGNSSATVPGNGLTNSEAPPVGQPQTSPSGINFRDRPGEITGDKQSYSSSAKPPLVDQQPASSQPDIKQPQPLRSSNLGSTAGSSTTSRHRGSSTNLEMDEEGRQALIGDFSGIVRLADAGALSSATGTGTGTGTGAGTGAGTGTGTGTGTGSAAGTGSRKAKRRHHRRHREKEGGSDMPSSGPTGAKLAQQQRATKVANTRATVQNFINEQAHTVNLPDPNAPTPSPTPHGEDDSLDTVDEEGARQAIPAATPAPEKEWESEESSRESSEMATASGDEKTEDSLVEEPIVTFRFEHIATDDGHHVVVGREGSLKRCEDEPITTPGAVQGFGVLVVLEEDYDSGRLKVRQVSENSTELLGLSPRYLFQLDCFTRILTNEQEDLLRDNIEYLPDADEGKGSVEEEGPQVFLLTGFGEPGSDDDEDEMMSASEAGRRREWSCWVAAHRPKQPDWDKVDEKGEPIDPPDLVVLEFELEKDLYNPLMQSYEANLSGGDTPEESSQGTVSAASVPQRSASVTNSTSSGDATSGSITTTGSASATPRPGMPTHSSGGSATIAGGPANSGSGSTQQVSFSTRPSSKVRSDKPMGLEGLDVEVPIERIIESTTNHAKPLRALERMRRTGMHLDGTSSGSGSGPTSGGRSRRSRRPPRAPVGNSTGTMDVFAVLGQINEQLGSAPDLESFLRITVGVVQDLCRFHRVLIYQFDEAYNGQVVAELVEWGKTTDLYKGLMFPAADIPAQARQLYMTNKVRLLYDRSQTTARMVLRSKDDLDHPLDMTHCYLRAMSPIHIKYLANMNVRSSMSVSIMAFGQLWGLIACHSYGHHGMRVSFPVRQMMRILSDSISRNIERLSYAQRLHTRKLISTIPTQHHPTGYIVSNADDLLQIFDADSGLLVIGDGCKLLGNNEQGTAMLAIAEFLRIMKFDNLKASNHISKDFPDVVLPRAQDTIAGLLYVPLTAKAGQDFIVFLRKGQVREVQWAGKPYKDERSGDAASLEPRKSFKMWSETVFGRSRAWTDDQLESAGVLALIYGKFIQVWREKQSAMASNQLTAILLSNTSHAVRTPLSQIINTLELALSGNIDSDVRSMLENSHQASRALLFHVHDLLDLTRIETGNETAFNDPFDVRQSISDALRLYQTESDRRGIEFRVNMAPDLPEQMIGDSRKIKTVISNLVANSVKFTEEGYIEVYCGIQQPNKSDNGSQSAVTRNGYLPIEIVVSDTGCGIPSEKLEAMFVTLEGAEELRTEATGLGLGLAVVARIVEQLGGQLRAESEVNVGTRIFFSLQMLVAGSVEAEAIGSTRPSSSNSLSVQKARKGSSDSGSGRSLSRRSHADSEIDSFVQDFASSHMLAPVAADDTRLRDAEERMARPGTFPVTDSSWPVRPSKMDTESQQSVGGGSGTASSHSPKPKSPNLLTSSSPAIGTGSPSSPHVGHHHHGHRSRKRGSTDSTKLRVMVVEDDAINSQILQKRLRMDKHSVIAVNNGQEAVDALRRDWDIDAILMDIQMPIMDGRTAAAEIRQLEQETTPPKSISPLRIDGRVPIFAVSASLYESDRSGLMENFDGWLLKPLDFTRVRTILSCLQNPGKRPLEVYVQGQWERGGFFRDGRRSSNISQQSDKTDGTEETEATERVEKKGRNRQNSKDVKAG